MRENMPGKLAQREQTENWSGAPPLLDVEGGGAITSDIELTPCLEGRKRGTAGSAGTSMAASAPRVAHASCYARASRSRRLESRFMLTEPRFLHRARSVVAVAVAAGLNSPGIAHAQVNTENLRKKIKTTGYSFIADGSLTGDTGNTQGIAVGGGLGGGWAHERHLLFAYARADYMKYGGVASVNKTFAHARYNYEFLRYVWGEIFAQAQSDAFQRLDLRNLFGLGPRFRVAHALVGDGVPVVHHGVRGAQENFDVFVGTAYMLERDAITAEPGTTGAQNQAIQIWHRWSNYLTIQWELDERAIVATTLYVQPAFNDFVDVRLLSETLFTFKVTKVFSASISGSVHYDSEPPTGVLPTDVEVKNTLSVTF